MIAAMNTTMLYADAYIIYDFHITYCFGDGDGHGGYRESECITIYDEAVMQYFTNGGGGSPTTGISSPTPSPNPPAEHTGNSPGGTSTNGQESLSDRETLVKENGELEEIDTHCRCSTICPVCDGCLMTDVPRGCEACSCIHLTPMGDPIDPITGYPDVTNRFNLDIEDAFNQFCGASYAFGEHVSNYGSLLNGMVSFPKDFMRYINIFVSEVKTGGSWDL